MNLPTDIAVQALDAIGSDVVIGDIEEGTREAQVLLRAYGQCLRQLLRAAHWNFARKQAPMQLLGDATGQTPNVGTQVVSPWIYEYAYPIDCMKVRFVPFSTTNPGIPPGNIALANPAPIPGTQSVPYPGGRLRPARFLEATDFNYPPQQGQITWEVQGVSPQGRTVILTNVQNAQAVYTALMLYPSVWDAQFRAAMVAYLASEVALALTKDKKLGRALRTDQIAIAKAKITAARISDGNEGTYSSDIPVDWMQARRTGGFGGWGGGGGGGDGWSGGGIVWGGWDSCGFSDGSSLSGASAY